MPAALCAGLSAVLLRLDGGDTLAATMGGRLRKLDRIGTKAYSFYIKLYGLTAKYRHFGGDLK